MRRRGRTTTIDHLRGMTLIEVAVLVCVLGVALAVFIPTFFRNVRTSKIAEASEVLARMHAAAATYYAKVHRIDRGPALIECLPPPAGPVPATPSENAVELDFQAETTPGHESFAALELVADHPLRYRYSFLPSANGCGLGKAGAQTRNPVHVTFRAEGDLDGDGQLSTFERTSTAMPNGVLRPIGVLEISNRVD